MRPASSIHLTRHSLISQKAKCPLASKAAQTLPFPISCPRPHVKGSKSHCSRGARPAVPHPCTKMVPSDCLRPDFRAAPTIVTGTTTDMDGLTACVIIVILTFTNHADTGHVCRRLAMIVDEQHQQEACHRPPQTNKESTSKSKCVGNPFPLILNSAHPSNKNSESVFIP